MALAASPPQAMDEVIGDTLDGEIAKVRAEIQNLTARRKLLTSSLLSSSNVQSRLFNNASTSASTGPDDSNATPLKLSNVKVHSQSNAHRLTFGVTSFPFTDPSPEIQSKNPLLGIRIDVCNRHGQFDSPYYIFCVRAGEEGGQGLRIHRHTIPALVPLEQYESEYLPLNPPYDDEGYAGSDDSRVENGVDHRRQDLHALVARVRHDLVSWRLRQDAAGWLQEELGLPQLKNGNKNANKSANSNPEGDDEEATNPDVEMDDRLDDEEAEDDESVGKFNIFSLTPLDVDARQLRLIWSDDRVGRLKISDTGRIEKAVVIGEDGARVRGVERILMGDDEKHGVGVTELVERLEKVYLRGLPVAREGEGEVATTEKGASGKSKSKRKRKS
jgi:central kinetochore subunit Mal2/MCM21